MSPTIANAVYIQAQNAIPKISVITVNFNQTELTCALLESIRQQDYDAIEVIVVDNASREDPGMFITKRYPETVYIRSERNLGFAGGNNLGIAASTGDFLFFVNNDAEITPGCIQTLLDVFRFHPNAGIVSPMVCYADNPHNNGEDLIQYAGMTAVNPLTGRNRTIGAKEQDQGQYQTPRQTAYAHGAAMMVPRLVLETVGPMDEGFFLYYEELDWCEQIRRAGYDAWVEPRAKVYHKESVSVQKLGALKTYFLTRNRIYFMRRNRSWLENALFTAFLFAITLPKNALIYWLQGEKSNLVAFWQGICWNFGRKDNPYERFRSEKPLNALSGAAR